MFEISFYNMKSEKNKIGKTKDLVSTLQGTLKEETSLIDPSIVIEAVAVPVSNYMYIPSFGRYYFITNIESVRNNLWRIDAHVDVLESYQNAIKENSALIERQENLYNLYLYDPEFLVQKNTFTFTVDLDNYKSFDTRTRILIASTDN